MDFKFLTYIIAIAEEKNITKAAERLFMSQSSLSYFLTKLEQNLGMQLFVRGRHELTPTQAGVLYVNAAYEMMQVKERLYQNLYALKNKTHIVISTTSLWGLKMFIDIVPKFQKDFPDVTLSLSHTDINFLEKEINEGKIDFALISLSSLEDSYKAAEVLRMEELFFAAPINHPYVIAHTESSIERDAIVSQFWDDCFLLSKKGTANRNLAEHIFLEERGELPSRINDVTGITITCDMIAQGVGVSFIPLSGISQQDKIHFYSISPKLYRYNVMQYRSQVVLNEPELAFFNYAKNYFNQTASP